MRKVIEAYHTKNEEQYNYLMEKLHREGYTWPFGANVIDRPIYWEYKGKTCICTYDNKTISYGDLKTVKEAGVLIKPVDLVE